MFEADETEISGSRLPCTAMGSVLPEAATSTTSGMARKGSGSTGRSKIKSIDAVGGSRVLLPDRF